jgi:hypothetical protein
MNIRRVSRSLLLSVGFLTLVAVALWLAIFGYFRTDPTTQQDMLKEVSRLLAQLTLVTLLGATVTFLYSLYSKDREQQKLQLEEDNGLRRRLLESVIGVRAGVEKARREFRLLPAREKRDGYRRTIEALLAARLQLSQVWHDTETWKQLYGKDGDEIKNGLNGMKIFLDGLIEEYEKRHAAIQAADKETAPQAILDLDCFGDFVNGDGGTEYTHLFLEHNYRTVARIIRKSILDSSQETAP